MNTLSRRSDRTEDGRYRMSFPSNFPRRVDTFPSLDILRMEWFNWSATRIFPDFSTQRPRGEWKRASDEIPSTFPLSFGFPAIVVTSILSFSFKSGDVISNVTLGIGRFLEI